MVKQLSSMKLAFVLLAALTLWFGGGMYLATDKELTHAFKLFNDQQLPDWLPLLGQHPVLQVWILGLVVLICLLIANTLACTCKDMHYVWLKRQWHNPKLLYLPIHLLTLAVFICHGLDILFIHGHQSWSMAQGQQVQHQGLTIEIKRINYMDNLTLIKEDKLPRITRRSIDDFHPDNNSVEVRFTLENGQQATEAIHFMSPLKLGNYYLLLTDFGYQQQLVADIKLVHNPMVNAFFTIYGLLFFTLALQALRLWRIAHTHHYKGSSCHQ